MNIKTDKTENFIKKAKLVWGDKFDYRDVKYIRNNVPVTIWYGDIKFQQQPNHHLEHRLPLCLSPKKKHTNDELIKKFNEVHHNAYTYGDFVYKNAKEKNIPVYCHKIGVDGKEHGLWYVNATNHLSGCGCPKCKAEKLSKYFASSKEDFIEKARKIHGNKYIYDKVEYKNNSTDVIITCPIHGDFKQVPHNHLQGKGCPLCNESHLEEIVRNTLENNKINYESYYHPQWLGKQSLDFYLPDYNIGIECQGEQHYKENHFFEPLSVAKERDFKKLELCKEHGIKLIYFANEKYQKGVITNINELVKIIDSKINVDKKNIDEIIQFLNENNIRFTYSISKIVHENDYITVQDTFDIYKFNLKIIYINSYEYRKKDENGIGINSSYFINETKKYNKEGIRVIWIKDYEMNDNDCGYRRKWEVIKSYIKYAVGICKNKVFARYCEIHEVPNAELKCFLKKNCFYGYRPAKVNLGLYLKKDIGELKKGELVMVYTFGSNFYGNEKDSVEAIRVSTLLDTHVDGGASKLLKFFINNYKTIKLGRKNVNVKKIIFYVDADHNNGVSLSNTGFIFERWTNGFMNVNSVTNQSEMRKPFKNDLINEMIKKNKIYVSPTNGVMTFVKQIKENLN